MGALETPRWLSEQKFEKYRATADECQTHARQARHAIDKDAWLKLAADWNTLAENAIREPPDG